MVEILTAVGTVIAALILLCVILSLAIYIACFTRAIKTESLYTETGMKKIRKRYSDAEWQKCVLPGIEEAKKLQGEKISVKNREGKTLKGVFYANENADTTMILFHGWHSCGENDFGCALADFMKLGVNVLIVSERGQAESDGNKICMGIKEKYDCAVWAEYIEKRFGKTHNVFLEGISMGAATVLFASGLELPENVSGIIADCGYTSVPDILRAVAKWQHIPSYPLLWLVALWFRLFSGCNIYSDSTLEALKKNTRPVLFLHGEADSFVPCYMSRQNYEACTAPKELITVKGADHGKSYLVEPERCMNALKSFVETYKK